MECWHCERPAHAVCRFCGRAVCREHVKPMPFILEVFRDKEGRNKAVVVDDTVHCGVCKPQDKPVALESLD